MSLGRSIPNSASIEHIIKDIFRNQKYTDYDSLKCKVTYSRVNLSDTQKVQLIYKPGFQPMNYYIIYQRDKYLRGNIASTSLHLVSLIYKDPDYIYGAYFDVINQPQYDLYTLKRSKIIQELSYDAKIVPSLYLEVYYNISGKVFILGISDDDNDTSLASLQYSHKNTYFCGGLSIDGINVPETKHIKLTSLSKNLKRNK